MLASGGLAYLFHVIAARRLGPDVYGQVAVLWGAMFLAAVVLFRPVEQTASRAIADRRVREVEVRSVLRSVVTLCLGASCVFAAVVAFSWGAVTDRLFVGNNLMTGFLVFGIVSYGLAYAVRGVVAGIRWFNGYALALMADAIVRLLVVLPLLLVASGWIAGIAVVSAGLAGVIVPLVYGRARLRQLLLPGTGSPFRVQRALRFAAPATVIAAADQLLVNGAPLLVMVGGGSHASRTAGIVFAATMLVRVPVYIFQGVAASLLPNLTDMHARGVGEFRSALRRVILVLVGFGALLVVAAAVAGPEMMTILFGADYPAPRTALILLAAGVTFYLAAATLSQALLALDRGRAAAVAWSAAAVTFVGGYAILPGSALIAISEAFAVATAVGAVALGALLLRSLRT
jgi:O-antigen/teichoic acid export membrane protein